MKLFTSSMSTDKLLNGSKEVMDVFGYHYYNGVSAPYTALANVPYRDKYAPGAEMWVTESGDAGGGGCEWASTYLDVVRTLNELGSFPTITDGVIFHNTLWQRKYA